MSKSHRLHFASRVIAATFIFCHIVGATAETACIVDAFDSTATSAAGILVACPQGDGDLLSANGLTITARLIGCVAPLPNVPATDIWVMGCRGSSLFLCSSSPPFVSGATDQNGVIVLDGRLFVGGCDNSGLHVVAQGFAILSCVPIQVRTMDLKSSGANACGGDQLCPDGKVNLADFAFFNMHYPTAKNPDATYFACVDFATPYGQPIGLADYAKYLTHLTSPVHGCS